MRFFFLFIITFLLFHSYGNAQNKCNYGFADYNDCSWDWMHLKKKCLISYNPEGEPQSLVIKYDNRISLGTSNMEFSLGKNIILPFINYQNLKVSVYTKNTSGDQLSLIVIGIDNSENIIFNKTVSLKGSLEWKELALVTKTKKIKAINIYIRYKGSADKSQIVGLKDIAVLMDNKNIQEINSDTSGNAKLSSRHIKLLKTNTSTELLANLPMIRNQKIIALGEDTHGSETISKNRFQFLKTLIVKHNCKVVLLEIPFDIGMLLNIYTQGLIPKSSETILKDYLSPAMNQETMMSFLNWLREYNQNVLKKVYIAGIDNSSASPMSLMDFHLELLGKEKSYPYLIKMYKEKNMNILELARKDTVLKNRLGKLNYTYYNYALNDKFSKDRDDRFANRDQNMANRVVAIDSIFTKKNEKITILAHSGHSQKIKEVTDQYQPVLGSILNTKYKRRYFAIDFNFGYGTFSQDSCSTNTYITTDVLRNIPKNSFEYAALKTGYSSFYYPAKYINSTINSKAYITRNSQNKDHFKFSDLKRRFDGYMFVREGNAFPNAEKEPLKYSLKLFTRKQKQYEALLNSMAQ